MAKVNVGLRIPSIQPTQPDKIRAYVQHAEGLGFHSIWVGDHVFHHVDVAQPLTLLTWVAALTNRVRLGTAIMLSSYLNPVLTAKAAATLDCLSGGRLTLGISAGGTESEYQSIGVPYNQRTGRLLEMTRIMRRLWAEEDGVSYEGRYHTLENANIRPKPAQPAGIPIYFGANSEAMMRRAARLADGWIGASAGNVDQFVENVARVRGWAAEAGRDPDSLGFAKLHNVTIDSTEDAAKQRLEAHFQRYYGPRYNAGNSAYGTLEQVRDHLERFAAAESPEVTLALELCDMDLGHLGLLANATEGLRAG